ncbi:hypothetical protein UlMin_031791 [Ulmus minor]
MTWKNRLSALVVDSVSTCRTIERLYLAAHGVMAWAVDCGQAAVELIQSGESYNLIVIDIHLPGRSGIEIVRQLRSIGVQSKIIGISGSFSEAERIAFLNAGGDYYYEKPLVAHHFLPILQELDNSV